MTIQEQKEQLKIQSQQIQDQKKQLERKDEIILEAKIKLSDCFKDYNLLILDMEQMSKELTRLQVQNSSLMQKNNEQKKQLDIIKNNILGKVGIKAYKMYKKYLKR